MGRGVSPRSSRGKGSDVCLDRGFDASPHLADDQHAEVKILVGYAREPRADPFVPSRSLAQVRQHVGVDEIAQSRTRRGFDLVLAKSRSVPTSGISPSHCLKPVRRRGDLNADFKR
jgi:hypothetical protein